ncbi:MAG TPA: PepSY domain-containing protein [Roseiarcus sp.]|nr:PepSY domain-containing protein [Roseiarcus sp.]
MSFSKARRAAVLAIVGSTLALPAYAYTGEEYASQAKIGIAQARKIALRAYPGKIVAEELEKESGGSGLRYSFDIAGAKGVHEVGVDARAGAVIENSKEGPHPD